MSDRLDDRGTGRCVHRAYRVGLEMQRTGIRE